MEERERDAGEERFSILKEGKSINRREKISLVHSVLGRVFMAFTRA